MHCAVYSHGEWRNNNLRKMSVCARAVRINAECAFAYMRRHSPLPAPRDANYILMSFMIADQFPQKNSICEVNLNTFDESMIKYEDWANSRSARRMVRHRAGVAAPTLFRERFLPRIAAATRRPLCLACASAPLYCNSRTRCSYESRGITLFT